MNPNLRYSLEKELYRIGDEFIASANMDESLVWKTLSINHENGEYRQQWTEKESLYSGSAGIILFLLELSRYTQEERFFAVAEQAMNNLIQYCRNTPTDYFALLSGRMGAVYLAVRFYQITKDASYLHSAFELSNNAKDFLHSSQLESDFMNGTAGTLLGLLHLHSALSDVYLDEAEQILDIINDYIESLVGQSNTGKQGLFWDKSPNQIQGLCGLSHGAAGVGFVFLELAQYFQNEAFQYIAEQAFLYESQHYEATVGNWKDFRKGVTTKAGYQEFAEHYLSGNRAYFTQCSYLNAWCHGSVGIGLTRLRASEVLLQRELLHYHIDIFRALTSTIITNVLPQSSEGNFSLCHGGGGNAELFIEAYSQGYGYQYYYCAEIIAQKALEQYSQIGNYRSGFGIADATEDRGLFLGTAGIGYFYLRLLTPHQTPSILIPKVQNQCKIKQRQYKWIDISVPDIKQIILEKNFPRTLIALKKHQPNFSNYFTALHTNHSENDSEKFIGLVQNLYEISIENKREIEGYFALEHRKFQMLISIESYAYLFVKAMVEADHSLDLLALPAEDFLSYSLKLNEDTDIIEISENLILLQSGLEGISEQNISHFTFMILNIFRQPITVAQALKQIVVQIETTSLETMQGIEVVIIEQIRQAVLSGIILGIKPQPKSD